MDSELVEIPGFKGCYVNRIGQVWVEPRKWYSGRSHSRLCSHDGMFLKPRVDKTGYWIVKMAGKNRKVHRLVAITFIPNPDNLPQVNHKDGNKRNSYVDNLEWVTPLGNARHAVQSGLVNHAGENNPKAKINWDTVHEIREAFNNGDKVTTIANCIGLPRQIVQRVAHNRFWVETR